jgi:drug/metabolite transporter (DMT)-like permease
MSASAPPLDLRAIGWVALGAITISFAAVLVKLIPLGPSVIGAGRCLAAGGALLLVSPLFGGLRGEPRAWGWALAAGVAFAADLWVWHRSIHAVGAGLATLLGNTQVFWVAAASALLLGERPSPRVWMAALVAIFGLSLVVRPDLSIDAERLAGVGYGLATGVCYAAYYLTLRRSRQLEAPLPMVGNLGVAAFSTGLLLTAAAAAEGEALPTDPRAIGLLLLLGVGVHIGGWLAVSRGMGRLPASRGSVVLLLQPALATVWGVLFFAEPLDLTGGIGVLLTLGAVAAASTAR